MWVRFTTTGTTAFQVKDREQAEILIEYFEAKENYEDEEAERLLKENEWLKDYYIEDGAGNIFEQLEYNGLNASIERY